ncbi:MAG: hypothetical protein NXH95_00285 [Pseudomonadaceae bacterium]|nr:hypothetical protein [Pseudomonadaceae bacterium]
MLRIRNSCLWFASTLIVLVTVLGLSELLLRSSVSLSSLVDPNDLYPKVWYLENFESVQSRGRHPVHASHEVLGWTHRKNLREPGFSTNSYGLRGTREYSFERQPGTSRVVVLGDSFSAGFGVEDEETFSAQLERLIPNSEFLNLAVSGYGVDQAVLRWETLGRRFQPDVVILGIFIPDFHRNTGTWWFDAPKPRFYIVNNTLTISSEELPPMEDVEANVQLIRNELDSLLRLPRVWIAGQFVFDRVLRKLRGSREADATFVEKQNILELLISRLAADCAKRGIDLLILTIPTEYSPYPDEDRILSFIVKAAESNNTALLALDRFLGTSAAEQRKEPVFDAQTGHWSASGHRRVAIQVADFLKAEGLSD